jgi:hypothetical protein
MAKTIDGIRINDILRTTMEAGVSIREGKSHAYILNYKTMRPCPLAKSTHAERMLAPWLAMATGTSKQECYQAIKRGYW